MASHGRSLRTVETLGLRSAFAPRIRILRCPRFSDDIGKGPFGFRAVGLARPPWSSKKMENV